MGIAPSDMHRVIAQAATGFIEFLGTFVKSPQATNDTLQAIEEIYERQEEERQQAIEEIYERQEEERQRRERADEERYRKREATATLREKAALAAARKSYKKAAQARVEAAPLAAGQAEEAARHREEAAFLAAKQIEVSARKREEAAVAEAQKARDALHRGIRPLVIPSPDQFSAAKARMQFDPSKLHFAVCGSSGSGKSTVINAVRGLSCVGEGAARVGVTECTSEVTRYPDPRDQLPYSRFVWYNIPGAGTTLVPDWQYFNDQGLFVFDFIIMVYDVRFTKIDVGIIENCLRFKIPVFIVRSKADQHVQNMIQAETDFGPTDTEYNLVYQKILERYVEATRSDFYSHMENMASNEKLDERDRQLLNSHRVYIVSGPTLRAVSSHRGSSLEKGGASNIIDEEELVEDMLRVAARRRYSSTPDASSLPRGGKGAPCAALSSVSVSIGSEKKKKGVHPKRAKGMLDPRASKNEDYIFLQ